MLRTLVTASVLALSPIAFGAGTGEVLDVTRLAQEEDSPDRVLFAVAASGARQAPPRTRAREPALTRARGTHALSCL